MDFNNIQLLKDNSNELNNNSNAKDNSLDLYTICQRQFNGLLKNLTQLTMICCTQVFEAGKVFCDSIPNVGVRMDPKFLPFPHILLATYTQLKDFISKLVECLMMSYPFCGILYCG